MCVLLGQFAAVSILFRVALLSFFSRFKYFRRVRYGPALETKLRHAIHSHELPIEERLSILLDVRAHLCVLVFAYVCE